MPTNNALKNLSRAQRALYGLAMDPANGFEVEIIEQAEVFAGTTEAVRQAEEVSLASLKPNVAQVLVAEANSAQSAVRQLCGYTNAHGADMSQRLANVIQQLAKGRDETKTDAVCLIFDEARHFKGGDIIKLLHTASHLAHRGQIPLRLIFIIGQLQRYDWQRRGYLTLDYPSVWRDEGIRKLYSPHARVWNYTSNRMTHKKAPRAWAINQETPLLEVVEREAIAS